MDGDFEPFSSNVRSSDSPARCFHADAILVALAVVAAIAAPAAQTDLDAFMARVLARRDDNWKKLQQYVLEERETFRVDGPAAIRLYGFEREYSGTSATACSCAAR